MKALLLTICLLGCVGATNPKISYERQNVPYPSIESFPHCRSYGCKKIDTVMLTPEEQKTVSLYFQTNENAKMERENIRHAVSYFENIIGNKTGTSADIAGTYVKMGHMQHDCIDESTNTTTYLILMNQMDLLKFHTPNALTSRAPILSGRLGPHRTAVIVENNSGTKYAVDSWFHDNGLKPEIIELSTWRWGWHPQK